jgi:hypothetical protein
MSTSAINASHAECCAIVVAGERGRLLERVASRLTQNGYSVGFLTPPLGEPVEPYRLIVLRAKSLDVTSWAKRQQQRGSTVVPNPRAIELIKDRWTCRQILMGAGMRLPDAVVGKPGELHAAGVRKLLPVVLKQRRAHGLPVRLVLDADELDDELNSRPGEVELVAERFIEGVHFTACFIGGRTFCFLKPPLRHGIDTAAPLSELPAGLLQCVKIYRAVSGLHFGKVDVVMAGQSGVIVVDGGVSPNLWQVSEAEELLSDYFLLLLSHETGASAKSGGRMSRLNAL